MLVLSAAAASSSGPEGATGGVPIEIRLERIETLTERSSAARHLRTSGSAEARQRYADARSLYRQAREAHTRGDQAAAGRLVDAAAKTMFSATRMAGSDVVLAGKRQRDFESRLASVSALLEAHERVSREKGVASQSAVLQDAVRREVAQASELAARGDPAAGREALDRAYVALKTAIESLRGGETLVRTLDFASKEEEYRYELDRNEAFRMLVDVLLAERREADAGLAPRIEPLLRSAAKTRRMAEGRASAGDFDAAVEQMEQATRQIARAMRSAGIYIPGG